MTLYVVGLQTKREVYNIIRYNTKERVIMNSPMENMNTVINHETEIRPDVLYLGSLEDLGLGNINGIPSDLAEASVEERTAYGEKLKEAIVSVTDFNHYGCIDGRNCVCNADGSEPEVRRRQVGGTGLLVEVAMNGEAPFLDTIDTSAPISTIINEVEKDYMVKTGVSRSAHLGGCGGVNGAKADNKAISENPAIIGVTRAIMEIPQVQQYSGLTFDPEITKRVTDKAGATAEWMEANNWDGSKYVEGVEKDDPTGVEKLETADDEFHGHKEAALVLLLSEDGSSTLSEKKLKELGLGEDFVVNVDASIDMAKALAGNRGQEGATQALISNLAKHAAVANRLPSTKTPVYFMYIPAQAA